MRPQEAPQFDADTIFERGRCWSRPRCPHESDRVAVRARDRVVQRLVAEGLDDCGRQSLKFVIPLQSALGHVRDIFWSVS